MIKFTFSNFDLVQFQELRKFTGLPNDQSFGAKKADEVLKLVHDLVEKAAEIKQLSFSRLLSYWKRRIATTLQRENALFVLNSSAHVLSATNRFDPECEPHLDEVLKQEIIHCS